MSKRMTPMTDAQYKELTAITNLNELKNRLIEDVVEQFEFKGWKGMNIVNWTREVNRANNVSILQFMLTNLYMSSNGMGVIK